MNEPAFSIADMVRQITAGTWGKIRSPEHTAVRRLAEEYGEPTGGYYRLPHDALRDASKATAGALVGTARIGYIETLRPASVVMRLGAVTDTVARTDVTIATGTGGVAVEWLTGENDEITESTPVFGSASAVPKLLGGYLEVSRRLLLQSNAEEILRRELRNAAAAALDAAVIAGTGGGGEPLGILGTPGIGSVSGTSLDYADIVEFQSDVASANGVVTPDALGWAAAVDAASLLKQRMKAASTWSPIWEGDLSDGIVEGKRAIGSNSVPDDALIYGDWSGVTLYDWEASGLLVSLDPYSQFTAGIVGMRILLGVDVVVTRPKSFAVATSIT
jgi:HK97 family phage major capsid protein